MDQSRALYFQSFAWKCSGIFTTKTIFLPFFPFCTTTTLSTAPLDLTPLSSHSYVEMNSDVVIYGCPPTLSLPPDFLPSSTSTHAFSLYVFDTHFGTLTLPSLPCFGSFFFFFFFELIVFYHSLSLSPSLYPRPISLSFFFLLFLSFVSIINAHTAYRLSKRWTGLTTRLRDPLVE